MPFGLCNAPATFQRAMTKILHNVVQRYGNLVMCYIDDVVIATATAEDHVQRLREVLTCPAWRWIEVEAYEMRDHERLRESTWEELLMKQAVYPDPDQTAVIEAWETPRNRREVQSFLGLANYYREFIINYAAKAKPLTELTKANRTFEWGPEAQQVFELLKKELCAEPVLGLADNEGTFYLDTDASEVAISGILHQEAGMEGTENLETHISTTEVES